MTSPSKHQEIANLCQAAAAGDVDAAKEALANGASVNGRVEYGKTPLMFAIQNAQVDMISFLKTKGARMNMLDEDGDHPMIYAFTNGGQDQNGSPIPQEQTMAVLRAVLLLGADKDAKGEFGTPAFHYAARRMDGKSLLELSDLGLDVGSIDPFSGGSCLHAMAQNKHLSRSDSSLLIGMALDKGVALDQRDSDKKTALTYALESGNDVFAQALLAKGASMPSLSMKDRRRNRQEVVSSLPANPSMPRPR